MSIPGKIPAVLQANGGPTS